MSRKSREHTKTEKSFVVFSNEKLGMIIHLKTLTEKTSNRNIVKNTLTINLHFKNYTHTDQVFILCLCDPLLRFHSIKH